MMVRMFALSCCSMLCLISTFAQALSEFYFLLYKKAILARTQPTHVESLIPQPIPIYCDVILVVTCMKHKITLVPYITDIERFSILPLVVRDSLVY